jgi:hypothetical protein
MAFDVALEDGKGEKFAVVGEPIGTPIARSVSKAVGSRFPLASTIDPYGDTVFNYIQAELLRQEWAALIAAADCERTKEALLQVDELLQRCVAERLFIKFYGD